MASNLNLRTTLNWTLPHLRFQPVMIGGGEPALTNANMIMQTILGPPFAWRWNRKTATFTCVPPGQDYPVTINDLGYIESAVITDPATSKPVEMSIKQNTQLDGSQPSRPLFISPQLDNNAGLITFRVMPPPDKPYVGTITYQAKPPIMSSVASFWNPIPDEMAYVFNTGFLALSLLITGDPRFQIFNSRFMAHLIAAAGGLDEMERNIFLGNWLQVTSMAQGAQLNTQQRIAARQQ